MDLDLDLLATRLFIIEKLQRNAIRSHASRLGGRVLDVGCGTKPYKDFISCESCIGIDESSSLDVEARASALWSPGVLRSLQPKG